MPTAAAAPGFATLSPGRLDYQQALQLQQLLLDQRPGKTFDTLMLLEHPPTITLGRGGNASNLRLSESTLAERGIPVLRVGRGGGCHLPRPRAAGRLSDR